MEIINKLQDWYEKNCDGYWEHQYGVKIYTIDNPGWRVQVSLSDTKLEAAVFEFEDIERDDDDWVHCWVKERKFEGAGGPKNLEELLQIFLNWAENVKQN